MYLDNIDVFDEKDRSKLRIILNKKTRRLTTKANKNFQNNVFL